MSGKNSKPQRSCFQTLEKKSKPPCYGFQALEKQCGPDFNHETHEFAQIKTRTVQGNFSATKTHKKSQNDADQILTTEHTDLHGLRQNRARQFFSHENTRKATKRCGSDFDHGCTRIKTRPCGAIFQPRKHTRSHKTMRIKF